MTGDPIFPPKSSLPLRRDSAQRRIEFGTYAGTFGTSLAIQICTILQSMLLARLLGPDGRGAYAAVILWPTIIGNIGLFGVNIAVARAAAIGMSVGSVFRTGLLLALLHATAAVVVGYSILPALLPEEHHSIVPLAKLFLVLYVPIYHLTSIVTAVDQGSGNFSRMNRLRGIRNPMFVLGLLTILVLGLSSLIWFVVASLAASGLTVLIWLRCHWKSYGMSGPRMPLSQMIRAAIPFGMVESIQQAYQYLDRILLVWLLPAEHIGYYVVAFSAASMVSVVTSSMGTVSFAVTAQSAPGEVFQKLAGILRKGVCVVALACMGLLVIVPVFLPLMYGERFRPAVYPGMVLVGGTGLAGLISLIDQCLRGQGLPFFGVTSKVLGVAIMGFVGSVAPTAWGAMGIALAYLASQAACMTFLVFLLLRHYQEGELSALLPGRSDLRASLTLPLQWVQKQAGRIHARSGMLMTRDSHESN